MKGIVNIAQKDEAVKQQCEMHKEVYRCLRGPQRIAGREKHWQDNMDDRIPP
jgi:hypothetical protein